MEMENLLFESDDEALTAVLHDNIATIVDSPHAQFLTSRKGQYNPNCTLISIGDGLFFPSRYALGLTKNSPFINNFSLAILQLREKSEIENLRVEYFDHRHTYTSEIAMSSVIRMLDTEKIDLQSFGGLFIFLGIAIVISLIFYLLNIYLNMGRILRL